jgi:hypothetical protein
VVWPISPAAGLDGQPGMLIQGDDAIPPSEGGGGTGATGRIRNLHIRFSNAATLPTIPERMTDTASVEAMLALYKREEHESWLS